MKCKVCGSSDVTQSKHKCNECLWIYEQQQKQKEEKKRIEMNKELFEQAMKRPPDYHKLSARRQWEIDDQLGILDWDGSCPHQERKPCSECIKRYKKRG
jgi:hypothetical protein